MFVTQSNKQDLLVYLNGCLMFQFICHVKIHICLRLILVQGEVIGKCNLVGSA